MTKLSDYEHRIKEREEADRQDYLNYLKLWRQIRSEQETDEEKALRLKKRREVYAQKMANESPEDRQARLESQRRRRANETKKVRERRLRKQREYDRKKRAAKK